MKQYTVRKFPINSEAGSDSFMEDIDKAISVMIWNDESPIKYEIVSTTTATINDQLYLIVTFGRDKS